jgi:RHS repeat-associated protein
MSLTNYSDTTPDVSIEYDALGRISSETSLVSSVSQSSVSYTYNPTTLALDTETITYTLPGQPAFTRVLDRSQDTLGRDSGYSLGSTPASGVGGGAPPPPELVTSYAYNPTDGRLSSISNPQLSNVSFAYGYETGSSLVKTVTGPVHTVTNTYESNRDILDTKENKAGTTTVSKYDYLVNALGQRSNVAQTGTAFAGSRDVTWGYDTLGQVTSAAHSIPGLNRAYAFDMIGNRLSGGDLGSPSSYTANALNQYSQITNNSITNNPVHDDDGNMTAGPLPANLTANSTLVWDGENRLIQAQIPGGATVTFTYDSQSRRIAETVGTTTKITIYDGWNPIAEYWRAGLQPASLAKSFTWGIDLSGTLQGAGGVGGLLAVTDSTGTYYPTYDGNGNVSEYLDSTGAIVAHYEYDPFGKTTVASGSKAQDFSHRFSTKPLDLTTGLYYYGYRFYDPATGRWPSRDPIGEGGGINLYGFVGNDGVNQWDYLGLFDPGNNKGECRMLCRRNSNSIEERHKCFEECEKIEYDRPNPGPGPFSHLNCNTGSTFIERDLSEWLEKNYSKSITEGENSISKDIDDEVIKLCFNKGSTVAEQSFAVGEKTQRRNSEYPGWINYMIKIGRFSMYGRNTKITWKKSGSKCSYSWSAEIHVEDVLGASKGQDLFNDVLNATQCFKERTVRYKTYTISGSGDCP